MGYAEKRADYWRGRYKIAPGKYGTVADAGRTIRFRTKREAEQAANDAEVEVRSGTWSDPAAGRKTFGDYASPWYAAQDLAESTMETYRQHIEGHLLPTFENMAVADILSADIAAWEVAIQVLVDLVVATRPGCRGADVTDLSMFGSLGVGAWGVVA